MRFLLPTGEQVTVGPGAIIGRASGAGVRVDHPSVSEASALVSLRGGHLKLLALRGLFRVESRALAEIRLDVGQVIWLAREVRLTVLDVVLPQHSLALSGFGPAPVELLSSVLSLWGAPAPRAVPGYDPQAPATVWDAGDRWMMRLQGGPPRELSPGDRFEVAGAPAAVVAIPLGAVAVTPTRQAGRLDPPVRVVARYETVHVHREGQPPSVIDGIPARLLSELIRFDAPTPWEWVAAEIWGGDLDRDSLRRRWDRSLGRLRIALREAGLDPERVRADGTGNVEWVVGPGDEVVDES